MLCSFDDTRGRFLLRPMDAVSTTLLRFLVYNLCIIVLVCILAVYSFDRVNVFLYKYLPKIFILLSAYSFGGVSFFIIRFPEIFLFSQFTHFP